MGRTAKNLARVSQAKLKLQQVDNSIELAKNSFHLN